MPVPVKAVLLFVKPNFSVSIAGTVLISLPIPVYFVL